VKYRWLGVVALLVLVEAGFFYLRYSDVVELSRPVDSLVSDSGFARTAKAVLERDQVSRRVLERIADVAARQQDHELQLTVLNRIAQQAPLDRDVQLRRADTLRAMGRLGEAELVYARLAGDITGVRP
jgi:hypothetical protein